MTKITRKEAMEIIQNENLNETFVEGNMCNNETNMKKWSKPFGLTIIWQKGRNHHYYISRYAD
jgi:hypothetical protein